jgi:anti-anti-sigma factor
VTDSIRYAELQGAYLIRFEGDIRVTLCASFDAFIDAMFENPQLNTILLDLSAAKNIDSTALGMVAKIAAQSKKRLKAPPTVYSTNSDIDRTLSCMGLDSVLDQVSSLDALGDRLKTFIKDMPLCDCSSEQMCKKVIEAHKALMALNSNNKEVFKELVSGLEEEQSTYLSHPDPVKH